MSDSARGMLIVARSQRQPEGSVREERLPFETLQELLDACVAHTRGAAFVRVQVTGESAGRQHSLVLDFGHFGQGAE